MRRVAPGAADPERSATAAFSSDRSGKTIRAHASADSPAPHHDTGSAHTDTCRRFEGVDAAFDFWAIDDEFEQFSDGQLEAADRLLFGRVTFDGMASYWPSADARATSPRTATLMNELPKTVVSTTLRTTAWSPTDVLTSLDELVSWKTETKGTTLLLGSPTLAGALLHEGLIDELRLLVNPVAIGAGRPLADCLHGRVALELEHTQRFNNSSVLNVYRPQL